MNQIEIEKKLLQIDIDLLKAASGNNIQIVKQLIDNGANVDAKNEHGNSVLHITAIYGKSEIAKLLINNGANPNIKNTNGKTPLSLAESYKREETVKILSRAVNPPILIKKLSERIEIKSLEKITKRLIEMEESGINIIDENTIKDEIKRLREETFNYYQTKLNLYIIKKVWRKIRRESINDTRTKSILGKNQEYYTENKEIIPFKTIFLQKEDERYKRLSRLNGR